MDPPHTSDPPPPAEQSGVHPDAGFSAEFRRLRAGSVLCWLATVDAHGVPNVSPKEIFCCHGGREILIANIASPQSVRNIQGHPQVCVSFVDVLVQKGFKVKGTAVIVKPDHPRFRELEIPLQAMTLGAFPIRSVICVQVQSTAPILAPSYYLRAGTTEESQARAAQAAYRWPRR